LLEEHKLTSPSKLDSKVVVPDNDLFSLFVFVELLLGVESHKVELARGQTLLNEEVARLGLLDSKDVSVDPGDLFSYQHPLAINASPFFGSDFVFDPVVKSQKLKLAFEVALLIYMEYCRLFGLRVPNHS